MLLNFFYALRNGGLPVSVKEWLVLLQALEAQLVFADVDQFYLLARTCLVKDEKYFDKFDRAFSAFFKDIASVDDIIDVLLPEDWLRAEFIKQLTPEEKAKIQSLGGLDKLIETFKQRLQEQKERHAGGSKWVGTGGTSPFGHSGYHPEGIRVGGEGRHKSAVKVWDQRQFRNLDDSVEIGTRNIKVALRKLRQFARSGAAQELDLDDTIRSTAKNAGMLDIKMVPERHNAVKVLLFFDVGGSMDPYITLCEELFSACKTEFKHMQYFYFHNFIYNAVWQDNSRRMTDMTQLFDILHTYSRDYKVIFVGDASMSPYEVASKYGSVELMNEEPGLVWMQRLTDTFEKVVWLNPVEKDHWHYTHSIKMIQTLLDDHMYPLTLSGLESAIKYLAK